MKMPEQDSLNTRAANSKPIAHMSPIVLPSGGTASASIKAGDTAPALKSFWIQRLKLAAELKGKLVETDHESPHLDVRAAPSESLYASDQAGQKIRVEEACGSIREGHVGGFLQEKASTKPELSLGDRAKSNAEKDSFPDASTLILNKEKDRVGDMQSQGFAGSKEVVARQLTGGATTASLKSGFGPWIKAKSGIRLEERSRLEPKRTGLTLMPTRTSAFSSPMGATQTCKQAGETEQGATKETSRLTSSVRRSGAGGTQAEAIAHANLGKPPLPPLRPGTFSRGRSKFASRPIGLKTQCFPFLPGRFSQSLSVQGMPVSDRVMPDSQFIVPPLQMSISKEGVTKTKVAGVDEERLTRVNEETGARGGATFEGPNPCKAGCSDLLSAHPKEHVANGVENGPQPSVISAAHMDNNAVISPHTASFEKVVPAVDFSHARLYSQSICRKSTMVQPPPIFPQSRREPSEGSGPTVAKRMCSVQDAKDANGVETAAIGTAPAVTDFHIELPRPGIGEPKMVKSGEVVLQTAVGELNSNPLQPTSLLRGGSSDSLETSHGAARSDRADEGVSEPAHNASSTASYPWGLFIGAAGTSRKAREQFVEVYNRARDDLKNQRASHVISRVPDKEMDDSARLASGQVANACDVPNYRLEKQSLESQKQPMLNLQSQEGFETSNAELEDTFQPVDPDGKALKLCLPERERLQSGRQIVSIGEGNVWASQDKGAQTFQTIHGADGWPGPGLETGQHVNSPGQHVNQHANSPGAPAMGFALNTYNSRQGESAILSRHTEGLKESELQFRVNPKVPQETFSHQNKDCQKKVEQRSDAVMHVACKVPRPEGNMHSQDQGFVSKPDLIHSQKIPLKLKESFLSEGLIPMAGGSKNRGDKKHGVSSLLGKRPHGVFSEVAIAGMDTDVSEKALIDGAERPPSRQHITEMPLTRPHVWLQRWHATPHNGKSMQGHIHGQFNGVGQHSNGGFALASCKFKDTGSNKLVGQTTEGRRVFLEGRFEKKQEIKFFQLHSGKVIPSPAAMAIVGTATRQLCLAQLQRKGSLAFW